MSVLGSRIFLPPGSITQLDWLSYVFLLKNVDLVLFSIAWNPKQPFINGCFNWMIPNLYIEYGCFTKHPFINGCLGFQVQIKKP